MGRQEGENVAEAVKECENERVSVFNQSGVKHIASLVFSTMLTAAELVANCSFHYVYLIWIM